MYNDCYIIVTYLFIHSFRSLSYDRFIASSKASSPQGAIKCFFLQFPITIMHVKFEITVIYIY
jgi:hypothetical protein